MEKTFTGVFVKQGVSVEDLEKYGFKGAGDGSFIAYWKPHFNCLEYEKAYYNDKVDYVVYVNKSRTVVVRPNGWSQISGKIQTLLFDMFTDGILEKKTVEVKSILRSK